MAGSINRVILVGNVGQDPQINKTQDGKNIASFSLGMNESWKDKNGEKKQKTEWIKVVVFGNLANIVETYVRKGSKLYIEGALQTRKWTDKNGVERYTTEVVLQGFNCNLQLLDSKEKAEKQDSQQPAKNEVEEELYDDEIPF